MDFEGFLQQLAAMMARPSVVNLPKLTDSKDVPLVMLPHGNGSYTAFDPKPILSSYKSRPDRRSGVAILKNVHSFVEWYNRHSAKESVIFAEIDPTGVSITDQKLRAIIDYHEEGEESIDPTSPRKARHCEFGAVYPFPWSLEMTTWHAVSRKPMGQIEMAEFIERHIDDVIVPPIKQGSGGDMVIITDDPEIDRVIGRLDVTLATPTDLMLLARGISMHAESKATQKYNHSTGESSLSFEEEHKAAQGGSESVRVPNFFLIAIPIFVGMESPVLMGVHLRYRLKAGVVTWFMEVHRVDRIIKHAVENVIETVAKETSAPVFIGMAKS